MFSIETSEPGSTIAEVIVRAYMADIVSRWHGREARLDEIDQAMKEEPYNDLHGNAGVLLVAIEEGQAIACAGARFVHDDMAELTKVFTLPNHRGRGAGTQLVHALEEISQDRAVAVMRLDTRAELTEACGLYERLGFVQVEPFNDEPYSDRWYAKVLELTG